MQEINSNGAQPLQPIQNLHHGNHQFNGKTTFIGRKVTPPTTLQKILHFTPVIQTIYGLGRFLIAAAYIPINRYKIYQLKGAQGQTLTTLQIKQKIINDKLKETALTAIPLLRNAQYVAKKVESLFKRHFQ
jgi:hypothetical protein